MSEQPQKKLEDYKVEVILPDNWAETKKELAFLLAESIYLQIVEEEKWDDIKHAMACILE